MAHLNTRCIGRRERRGGNALREPFPQRGSYPSPPVVAVSPAGTVTASMCGAVRVSAWHDPEQECCGKPLKQGVNAKVYVQQKV